MADSSRLDSLKLLVTHFENACANYWMRDRDESVSDRRLRELDDKMQAKKAELYAALESALSETNNPSSPSRNYLQAAIDAFASDTEGLTLDADTWNQMRAAISAVLSETAQTKEKHGLHDGLRDEPAPSGVAASSQEKVTETLDWNEDKMPYQHWCDECNAVFIGGKERRTCKACVTRRNDKTRSQKIHEHDCPQVWEFYRKHSMGSKLCPSCLLCGNAEPDREQWAITHMELPDIYICAPCVTAARSATRPTYMRIPPSDCRSKNFRITVDGPSWTCDCGATNTSPQCRRSEGSTAT